MIFIFILYYNSNTENCHYEKEIIDYDLSNELFCYCWQSTKEDMTLKMM